MNIVQKLLPIELRKAATHAFRDNTKLTHTSPEEREQAAHAYEQMALETVGRKAEIARLYNLERARFLRGEVERIAPKAYLFAQEKGHHDDR